MDENTTPTTPETEAAVETAEVSTTEATPATPAETTAKYDLGKFQKAIDEGKLTTDILDDVYSHGPGWWSRINQLNKQAADEKNKAAALRVELEKKLKESPSPARIEKVEDHPAVKAVNQLAESLIAEGHDQEYVKGLVERATRMAKEDIARQDYIRKDEISQLFENMARQQESAILVNKSANTLAEKYKIDADESVALIAAFQGNDETPEDGLRKAISFIERLKTEALKEPKPKPKPTIVSPGTTATPSPGHQEGDDKFIAQKQAELVARYTKG